MTWTSSGLPGRPNRVLGSAPTRQPAALSCRSERTFRWTPALAAVDCAQDASPVSLAGLLRHSAERAEPRDGAAGDGVERKIPGCEGEGWERLRGEHGMARADACGGWRGGGGSGGGNGVGRAGGRGRVGLGGGVPGDSLLANGA